MMDYRSVKIENLNKGHIFLSKKTETFQCMINLQKSHFSSVTDCLPL